MLTFFGILAIIAFVVTLFINARIKSQWKSYRVDKEKWDNLDKDNRRYLSSPDAPSNREDLIPTKAPLILGVLGVVLVMFGSFMFYARPGHQYYLVSPFGVKSAVFNSGYHLKLPFTRIQEWEKYVDIKSVREGEPTEGIEGVIDGGVPIRFIDQVTANVEVSVRMQLPTDEPSFIALAEEFRHPRNLVRNTLVPTVREQIINTGYMFAAQDYISGSASDFRQALDDQLKNGGFSVEKKEIIDTTYLNTDIQEPNQRKIREINTRYEVKIRQKEGLPIRIPHDITKNNIIVSQVIVDRLELEQAFRVRLEKQRDIASQKRIEMEAVEAAKIAQQKIIAEGERDKAAERVAKEREQIQTLIAIETQVKQEESKRELAEIALKTAELEAKAQKVRADAESYQNRQLVSAGLTPQERAKFEKETAIGVAAEIAKLKLPEVYMNGGGSSQSGLLESLIGADIAKQMRSGK
jgi:hypothetical protein